MKILLPIDGSDAAMRTVAWASAILKPQAYYIMTVLPPPQPAVPTLDLDLEEYALDDVLPKAAQIVEAQHGQVMQMETVIGDAAEEICRYAGNIDADLIVMGSQEHTRLENLVWGNISEDVYQKAPCPVLVNKNSAHLLPPQERVNILLLYDGTRKFERMLHWALDALDPGKIRYYLISVLPVPEPDIGMESIWETSAPNLEMTLTRAVELLEESGATLASVSQLFVGSSKQIDRFAEEHLIHLVLLSDALCPPVLSEDLQQMYSQIYDHTHQAVMVFRPKAHQRVSSTGSPDSKYED